MNSLEDVGSTMETVVSFRGRGPIGGPAAEPASRGQIGLLSDLPGSQASVFLADMHECIVDRFTYLFAL